ncbi:hypothetical protein DEA8626_02370 [Defluviimonas aquaemixtae]|uniref:Uncharacterized protein n=1 Tax=Albidovulum aquaemixtae TaxID=1542388 RepID=A0A2R8B848_9RHOB|nr:hypothetical protein DEA8626_02370 [Defluviimonas aquaemixtae]
MSNSTKLSLLTRSLMVGVSTGTMAVTQVGCAPLFQTHETRTANVSAEEQRLSSRALESRLPADVEAFVRAYPESPKVAPLLNTLPLSTLCAVGEDALQGIPDSTWAKVSSDRRNALCGNRRVASPVQNVSSSDRDNDY